MVENCQYGLNGGEETAGPSTALRFGQDDIVQGMVLGIPRPRIRTWGTRHCCYPTLPVQQRDRKDGAPSVFVFAAKPRLAGRAVLPDGAVFCWGHGLAGFAGEGLLELGQVYDDSIHAEFFG